MANMEWIPLAWIGVAALFALIEALTQGLTSIWFSGGAAVASIVSLFTNNIILQVSMFVVISIALLILTRPYVRKHFNREIKRTNVDALLGMRGVVVASIGRFECGAVRADGKVWTASAEIDIDLGTEVIITGINGVTITVIPANKEE